MVNKYYIKTNSSSFAFKEANRILEVKNNFRTKRKLKKLQIKIIKRSPTGSGYNAFFELKK